MTQKRATEPVKRRRVGGQLRLWREAAGLKPRDAAKLVGLDGPQLSRMERGVYPVKAERVRTFAKLYEFDDEAAIEAVAEAAEVPLGTGWWAPYAPFVSQAYLDFIELESEATTIRTHHPTVIPGLLQAPGYAREIISREGAAPSERPVKRLVAIRTGRQEVFTRDVPVQVHALVHETALKAHFKSGTIVMREQLRQMIDYSELPGVTIQIIPLTTHPAYGADGAFTLLSFAHPWPSVTSIDGPGGGSHTEDPELFDVQSDEFESIASVSLTHGDSQQFLREQLEELQS
ncbi:helix-turn-helix domain-containing protein [Streptomyces sp. GS7]|uniref:helix-turn-helix domain-containing protein n=1 Tax=Streptomyces sp. GS7 TaxID=2692234 RepID=UPI0013171593|nr:helix-turn-helix transcriptional regulator [Streptomyces sp. GS7]QHC26370.1 helix-turn-helix domain-containing protein [Streptomyces sp. GS7]